MEVPQPSLQLTASVNQLLKASAVPAALTIEQCANDLSMSMTSFRRKLAQEETSYKLIHQKYLNELCVHGLLTKKHRIDELSTLLGYSERATFERAFKQKFGITPRQFRTLAEAINVLVGKQSLINIAKDLPPMPDSCQALLDAEKSEDFDLQLAVDIVGKDPIFSGRIIGLASKAIYGKTPTNLKEAIGRNLGVSSVINFAVVYGMKDALNQHVDPLIIDRYSKVFMLAPKFLQLAKKKVTKPWFKNSVLAEQVLVFGLLGVFLLSHKSSEQQSFVKHSISGIEEITSLNHHLQRSLSLGLFTASALLLSVWHLDASIIKQLARLDKVCAGKVSNSHEDELMLLLINCLYRCAARHDYKEDLVEKAELLGVNNFKSLWDVLSYSMT